MVLPKLSFHISWLHLGEAMAFPGEGDEVGQVGDIEGLARASDLTRSAP